MYDEFIGNLMAPTFDSKETEEPEVGQSGEKVFSSFY
jgi:hypothetical protein